MDGFLLSIWFDKIPEKTVVWSANRNDPVEKGSVVELTTDGNLVVKDQKGRQVWSPISADTGISYAALLDTGNLVLASQDNTILWQSFENPTDTLLPTQTMKLDTQVIAHYTETNYSSGQYKFMLQRDGNLLLYTTNFPSNDAVAPYWSTQDSIDNMRIRRVLSTSGGRWPKAWTALSFQPSNICKRIGGGYGGGACGYNSYCRLSDAEQRPICQCIPGYTFIDPNDIRKGCRLNFSFCDDEGSQQTNLFKIVMMPSADWFDSSYEQFEGVTEDCSSRSTENSAGSEKSVNGNKDQSTLIRVGSVLLGGSMLLNLLLLLFYRSKKKQAMVQSQKLMPSLYLETFTYSELEKATNGFKDELGHGAFGTAYKGDLATEPAAVKKLDKMERHGEQEFKAEVTAIGRTNHKNLVHLLGYCSEGQNRLLVYKYMRNGSLAKFLFENSIPNWYERTRIALGIAEGLCYLHEQCSSRILHCDIKPENILLDDTFSARISDFGLLKLLKNDQSRTTTAIRGTKGYVAPEWFKNVAITIKVDVYSFGTLLLEVICCRKNFEQDVEEEEEMILADWVYDCYKSGTLHCLVEKDEEAMKDMKKVKKFVMIAIWCIQEDPSLRPMMKEVIQMMEAPVEVPVPPDPNSFLSSI
ncbi:hypothetical protein Gohar_019247 [Gossypium harknessii]|uniref:non-specific serine/threonine protein kinase n=1 Tax=Gossypium harknessii TaxID=34285 RepID=A0A7J9GBL3_9ROSI|nr:hypothetical protein [Gossypium harknessii]